MSGGNGQNGGPRTYPVHLRMEGRKVLVVGAGRIAMRRLERLVETGARIRVIAPQVLPEIEQLAATGLLELGRREFEPADLQDVWMVHAAAEEPDVNAAVIAAARQAAGPDGPVLVSAADPSWNDGDFIVPATFDHGIATVSVGTGGLDYRKARDIKAALKRQLDAVANAELMVVGADRRCVDRERFEKVCREAGEERRLRATLAGLRHVDEFFVLNTCNRFEVYMIAGNNPIIQELVVHGMRLHTLPADERYAYRGREAFVHLSLVLAGAYAELFGETAVVAQVKESLERSRADETAGPRLARYFDEALNVSRRVRTAVMSGLESREAEDLCAARLDTCRPTLENETVLVIGTGAVGRAVIGRIGGRPKQIYWAFFRRAPDLEGLPRERIEVIGVDQVPAVLSRCAVVVVASGAKEPIIRAEHLPLLTGRHALLLDLSVPRGVDPALEHRDDVDLVNLQDLVSSAKPSDVPGLVRLSEESARLESYRYLKDDAVFP